MPESFTRKVRGMGSPWLELVVMTCSVVLSYLALLFITRGSEVPPGGMALTSITLVIFGFFLLSFAIAVIAVGAAPSSLVGSLNLTPPDAPDVSRWGLGLIYVVPWLLGAWLARAGRQIGRYLELAAEVANLDWFYRAAGWVGRQLVAAIYWLGRVGEGDGWWGWALIIAALAAILLGARG